VAVTDERGRVFVTRQREPFELAVLGLSLAYGLVCTVDYSVAATAIRTYPFYGGRVFLALLIIGASTALIGLVRNTVAGMRWEKAGLWLLAAVGAGYFAWAPFAIGWRGVGLMLFLGLLLALPSAWVARRLDMLLDDVDRRVVDRGDVTGA
jgi:uncharacterized membrane protein